MRMLSQLTEKNLKQLGLVTLLVGGLCAHAFAQSPSLSSLPSLPPLAQLPGVPASPASPAAPASPASPIAPGFNVSKSEKSENLSPLPPGSLSEAAKEEQKKNAELMANPLANLPPPQTDSSEGPTAAAPAAEALPAMPLPALPDTKMADAPPPLPAFPAIPAAGSGLIIPGDGAPVELGTATVLPQIRVVRDKATPKSWQTVLAPQVIPPKTNFRYRRVVLPGTIYRDTYDRDNRHLPLRETREQYEALLFNSVAKNDVEGTRALLNFGTSLNATNAYGETPRMMAERIGAFDVAALLSARGGR